MTIEKKYEKMDASDLFASIWDEMTDEVQQETATGKTLSETVTSPRVALAKSQKAKSFLKYVQSYKAGNAKWKAPMTELVLLEDTYDVVEKAYKRVMAHDMDGKGIAFLRACPEFARHGVLESIQVTEETLRDDWKDLRGQMKEHDPNGCMILQPFISASSSSVLGPQEYAAISEGHDGITAGHGRVLYFILNPDDTLMTEHIASLGHKHGEYEMEFVYQRDENFKVAKSSGPQAYITQIRGAPPHGVREAPFTYVGDDGVSRTASTDVAIPDGVVVVKDAYVATGLEEMQYLEEKVNKDTMPEGFVISHPSGSLMSHVCAHARQHGIPYICAKVNVGERWVEGSPSWGACGEKIVPKPYNPCSPDMIAGFKKGVQRSQTHWQRQHGWLGHFFHQWAGMNYNGTMSAYLAGGFCGWMSKAILALCLGEMRYARTLKKDATVDLWPTLTAMVGAPKWIELLDGGTGKASSTDRKHYYMAMERLSIDPRETKAALEWCVRMFSTGWSGAYGGKAWAECAQHGVNVCNALIEFNRTANDETLTDLMGAVNNAKNAEHNNGFLYGKFLDKRAFDYSSAHPVTDANGNTKVSGLFPHNTHGLSSMFRAYELAKEFIEGPANEKVSAPENDWMGLFGFLKGKGVNYWRQHFIGMDEYVIQPLKDAAIVCGPEMLHLNNKYTTGANFVPCGIEDCKTCKDNDVVVMKLKYGSDATAIMLTPMFPETFMVGPSGDKSGIDTYAVCQLLKDKKYTEVTAQMWVAGWNGLDNQDPAYPMLSGLMTKFAKNQMGDDPEWTDAVLKILKEEIE